jgi:hypothetical protein
VASAIGPGDNVGESSSKTCSASPINVYPCELLRLGRRAAVLSGAGAHSRAVEHGHHHLSIDRLCCQQNARLSRLVYVDIRGRDLEVCRGTAAGKPSRSVDARLR